MGTSGSSSGSGSNTPLVPSWLDGMDTDPLPGGDDSQTPDDGSDGQVPPPGDRDSDKRPLLPPPAEPERFRSARSNFSRFAGSGGSDGGAFEEQYVTTSAAARAEAEMRFDAWDHRVRRQAMYWAFSGAFSAMECRRLCANSTSKACRAKVCRTYSSA
ncbi:MAG: hypothetical protein HYX78_01815 [Armatimonadetes bacterium]|nr:hypothetical protein [Armatimonadota bacterium]